MNYTAKDYLAFSEELKKINCDALVDSPLSKHTSFKTGGNADIVISPTDIHSLCKAIEFLKKNNMEWLIIGNGSNIIFRDSGINGAVIKTTSMEPCISVSGNVISCSAGTSLAKLCTTALDNSLTGLEFAYGIPGTVGGAVYMNAGAYGGEMNDVLKSVTVINTVNGVISEYPASNLNLSYRHSIFSENADLIILSAVFELQCSDATQIKAKMNELMSKRKEKQPLEYPSAGSTFKRPEGHFAGALIEQCGLKGYSIGGAEVSEKHAGFIVNKNSATSTDIINLIEYVTNTVKEKTGITLEPEVKIIP